jgi:hypothetical protein
MERIVACCYIDLNKWSRDENVSRGSIDESIV